MLKQKGFTIVELLIVIVVIGILAAITIVAYSGISQRAAISTLQSDLSNTRTQLELDRADSETETYPDDIDSYKRSEGVTLEYTSDGNSYCVTASSEQANTSYNLNSTTGQISEGVCSGHTGGGEITFDQPESCPTGFIPVPGIASLGTAGGFCVMKYEAKNVGGIATSQAAGAPWYYITQTNAAVAAANACSGCHLITEAEWMTVAANILSVGSNWSGGSVGSGYVYQGHVNGNPSTHIAASTDDSDGMFGITGGTGSTVGTNSKRTLSLPNGEVIWDFGGNLNEWTATVQVVSNIGVVGDTAGTYTWREWTLGSLSFGNLPSVSRPSALASLPGLSNITSWNSSQGIGRFQTSYAETTSRAFFRGGSHQSIHAPSYGILALSLFRDSATQDLYTGFRAAQ